MKERSVGVLPDHMLKQVMQGYKWGIHEDYINPASVDLPLSQEGYRLDCVCMPRRGETVRDALRQVGVNPRKFSFDQPLEVGVNYIFRIDGNISLPRDVYGYVNPKSSTGRNNLFSRVIADGVPHYDALKPNGFSGEVWIQARPDSYPVLLSPGVALSQVRLFDGYTKLSRTDIDLAFLNHKLLYQDGDPISFQDAEVDGDGSVFLTLNFDNPGWECGVSQSVVDFARRDLDYRQWYTPVPVRDGAIHFYRDRFYILATDEYVRVPPHLSAELRPMDPRFGEFRAHAAGYIDPGWGWGKCGRKRGQRITLEVIPHEDFVIRPGQVVAKLRYEHMKYVPDRHYHELDSSNYRETATVSLAKQFKR